MPGDPVLKGVAIRGQVCNTIGAMRKTQATRKGQLMFWYGRSGSKIGGVPSYAVARETLERFLCSLDDEEWAQRIDPDGYYYVSIGTVVWSRPPNRVWHLR